ncbi:ATP-binding cassette domain-containing protein [Nonomuraea sp. NPDC004580]|uniref:ATP-binding cassette domain-containing protein n=1 Tax=Nonomuraea sp. NPDC004580 TaxID=3154552 RepID=UPI0033BB96F4
MHHLLGDHLVRTRSPELPERGLTALVGPSGSGKTTVTRLPARFWDVDAGAIRFRGHDVRALPHQTLLSSIAIAFQDVYLFEGTVEQNVRRRRRPGASDAGFVREWHAGEGWTLRPRTGA